MNPEVCGDFADGNNFRFGRPAASFLRPPKLRRKSRTAAPKPGREGFGRAAVLTGMVGGTHPDVGKKRRCYHKQFMYLWVCFIHLKLVLDIANLAIN
jgi:hypothetical protein